MRKRLAHSIIRRYPQPWRERYEDELLVFIEDVPPRLGDVLDLARGCVVERAQALIEPGDRPRLVRAAIVLAHLAVPISLFLLASGIGTGLRAAIGPPPEVLTVVILTAWIVTIIAGCRLSLQQPPASRWFLHTPGARALLRVLVVLAVLGSWGEAFSAGSYWFLMIWFLRGTGSLGIPGAEITEAVDRLGDVRYQISWARMELKRCETLASQGIVTADLDRARAEMVRLRRQEDEALQGLRAMGYRARFHVGARRG